jgi:hypothetical protein
MKIKGEDIYTLSGIYTKIFQSTEFDSFKEARDFAKEAKLYEEEAKIVDSLRDKVLKKHEWETKKEKTNEDVALVNRDISEVLSEEYEVNNVIKIKEKYANGVIRSAKEASLLDSLGLIQEDGE